jgi:hypothetical protein
MVDNYEKAVGLSSEWRTPPFIFAALALQFDLDPCAPVNGFYCVPATTRLTVHDNGLRASWRGGLTFVNPPWSEGRGAVVPWLRRFYAHRGGGIFVCVARTSCDWWCELVWPLSELILFPRGKTRFLRADGNPGPSPTNGVALIGKGDVACAALRRCGNGLLGFSVTADRSMAPPASSRKAVS